MNSNSSRPDSDRVDQQNESGSGSCYLAVSRSGETYASESAHDVSIFMWGKMASKWTIYKRCPFRSGDIAELRDMMEAR